MNKKILIGIFILIALGALWFLRPSTADSSTQLIQAADNVATSNGTLNFQNGTIVGGNPTTYITLTEGRTFQTATGPVYFNAGTEVDCNPPPGYPNPCTLS